MKVEPETFQVYTAMFAVTMLVGCATSESMQAWQDCKNEALQRFPSSFVQQSVQKYRLVERPDGNTSCTSRDVVVGGTVGRPIFERRTECIQGTRLEREYYNDVVQFDTNYERRLNYVSQCTPNLCITRYGNRDCKK